MKRIFGIDLLRAIAIFFVLSVHFFLNNNFYNTNISGIGMFISLFMRWIFYIGVPIFILLTGYLKKDKELNKKYYKGIIHVLTSYLFISIVCIIFRIFYLNESMSKLKMLVSIFDFTADGYAWYIEMYLGLFLLIPFLNILYNNIKTKKNKQYLIITLLIMTSFSPMINYLKIRNIRLEFIPNWWDQIYPLIYYFIGCYINEYKIKINKKKGVLIFLGLILFETIITYTFNYNNHFDWNFFGGYNSFQTVIISTILFLLIYDIKINSSKISKLISTISLLSLDMYLFSYIVDNIVYKVLDKYLKTPVEYLKYYILIIIILFILSFALAYIKKLIFDLTKKVIRK